MRNRNTDKSSSEKSYLQYAAGGIGSVFIGVVIPMQKILKVTSN